MTRVPVAALATVLLFAAVSTLASAAGPAAITGTTQNAAAAAPLRFEPAPVPNHDLFAPVQPANEDPQLRPALLQTHSGFHGDAVLPGSSAQSYEERHMNPGYGLNLQVPLK